MIGKYVTKWNDNESARQSLHYVSCLPIFVLSYKPIRPVAKFSESEKIKNNTLTKYFNAKNA